MTAAQKTFWLIELMDKVTGPMKKIQAAARAGAADMDKLSDRANRVTETFRTLGGVVGRLALTVGLESLTQQSMAFEKGMHLVNTVMKQTPEQLLVTSDQVRALSKEIPLMRDQFTTGLNDVVQAGVPAADAIKFLGDSARAAVGGQADLGEVVRTTVSIIKAYGLEWDKQEEIQNRMQKAVDIGMMSMGEFAAALPKVTVLGSSLGVGIDELTGAFAAMTGVTGNASEVATQLSSVMSGLIAPSADAAKMSKQLGIAFSAQSIKKSGGLANYLDQLMPKIDAFSKRTGQSKESIIESLFGRKEAIVGLLALTGNLQGAWKSATTEMANSAGAVDYAFGQMNNTVDAKLTKMKNTVFAWWDGLYEKAVPVLSSIIEKIGDVFNWLSKFPEQHPYITGTILVVAGLEVAMWAFTSATMWASGAWTALMTSLNGSMITKVIGMIVTLGAGVLGLQAPFWAATSSTWALNAALWANPITWIIGLIAGLIAGIVLMIKYWDDVKAWFQGFGRWMYDHWPFKWVIELVKKYLPQLKAAFASVATVFKIMFKPIGDFFAWIGDIIDKIWNSIKKMFGAMADLVGLPKNLDFRDYGVAKTAAAPASITQEILPATTLTTTNDVDKTKTKDLTTTDLAGGSSQAGMAISGGEGKIVNFKNDFKITVNGATKATKETAEEILRIITDGLSDQAIAISNM